MRADVDLDIGRKTFTSGLLPGLIAVLRRSRPGDLVAVVGDEERIGPELETWCRFTGNALLEATFEKGRPRWVFRCGTVRCPKTSGRWARGFGSTRISTVTCIATTAACVPRPPRRDGNWGSYAYSGSLVRRRNLASKKIFVTGGEPFLLEDIGRDSAFLRCSRPDHGAD
jgi:hypothetical protein